MASPLHVVDDRLRLAPEGSRRPIDHRCPEDVLGFLFTRESQLQAELAGVRRQLDVHRIRYSDKHGLRVRAGVDTLRRLFGPSTEQPQGERR